VITYTVTFNTSSTEYDSSIKNTAKATTETDAGELEDDSSTTTNVVNSTVSKTGEYDSDTNTITWTIVLNSSNGNIAGYTLSDAMFADTSDLKVTGGSSSDYTYVYDSDKNLIGIKFNATDSDGDNDSTTNTNTYTITYTTTVDAASLGSASYTVSNTATVYDDEDKEASKDTGDVTVDGDNGKLDKELTDADDSTATDTNGTVTRVLNWTTTVTVPEGGITSGTVLYDYLGKSSNDTDSYKSTSSTDQWFTYIQITDLFSGLATNGITVGSTTISYNSGVNFTLEAYDATSEQWVTYSNLTSDSSTYSTHLFTAYKITFNDDFDVSGTWELTYSTTADITDVDDGTATSEYYYNYTKIGSLSDNDYYVENGKVYKMDGNWGTADSTVKINESGTVTLTWIVSVYIQPGSTETYTVTDYLPAGVTFNSAKVSVNYVEATLTDDDGDGNMSATLWNSPSSTVTGTVDTSGTGTTVSISITPANYAAYATSGGYATITYTVTTDNIDLSSYSESGTYTVTSYTNKVSVTYGSDNYGEDDQTQDIVYTKTEEGGDESGDHDVVDKSGEYVSGDSTLRYSVLLNQDANTLNEGNDLTFTDYISLYYSGTNYNSALLSLVQSSVKFYQLCEITYDSSTDTGTYVDSNGETQTVANVSTNSNVYTYTESDNSVTYYYMEGISVAWTYNETDNGYGTHTYTIKATVPDSTAILVVYRYNLVGVEGLYFSVTNTAKLTYDSGSTDQDQDTETDEWTESKTSGGITSGSGITIYKVKQGNYGVTLQGAKFAFYKYNASAGEWVQITYDDFSLGYIKNDDGSTTTITNWNTNPMDSEDYLVTGSNGTISIASTFSYTTESGETAYAYYNWYEEETLYRIVEVVPPDGYKITAPEYIYFYWSDSDDGTSVSYPSGLDTTSETVYDLKATTLNPTVYIENEQDVHLPSTGGMGTRRFWLIGLILCGGAGFALIRRRRRYHI